MVARETLRFMPFVPRSARRSEVQKPLPNMRQGDRRLTHALAGAGRYPKRPSALKTHRRVPLSHGAVIGVSTHRRIRCCWEKGPGAAESPQTGGVTPGPSFGRSFFLGSSGEPRCRHHKTGESDIALRSKLPGHSYAFAARSALADSLVRLNACDAEATGQLAPNAASFLHGTILQHLAFIDRLLSQYPCGSKCRP